MADPGAGDATAPRMFLKGEPQQQQHQQDTLASGDAASHHGVSALTALDTNGGSSSPSSSSDRADPLSDQATLAASTRGDNTKTGGTPANGELANIALEHKKDVDEQGGQPIRRSDSMRSMLTRRGTGLTENDFDELERQLTRHLSRSQTSLSQANPESERFDLEVFLKKMFARSQDEGLHRRESSVVFEDLCVDGIGSGVTFGETVGSVFMKPLSIFSNWKQFRHKPVKHILQNFTGAVQPGEMFLVLGRPGAGCSTLLKTLANNTHSYSDIRGEISFGGISPEEMSKNFAGDVAYLPEDDIHLPVLTVDQTLDFAANARAPAAEGRLGSRDEYVKTMKAVLLAIFGLRGTVNTKVGGDYVRGISGGQRKRVSIAELMTTRARIACHDNSTRGLDASTALEYVQALRVACNITKVTTIVSIYQAAENLYNLFDKVCLIYEGRQIYMGPRDAAKEYFQSLGYEPQPRQTTPDFLCAITDPNARVPTENFQGYRPQTPDEFAKAFRESHIGQANLREVQEIKGTFNEEAMESYRQSAKKERVAGLGQKAATKTSSSSARKADDKANPYVISYWQQTRLCIRRRVQLALGDIPSLVIPIIAAIIQAIIMGSTFFRIPDSTIGFFSRGGVIFFAILFNAFQAMAEITVSYTQRPVIVRQRRYAMVHPSADALAQTLVDFPLKFGVVLVFDIVLYFFTNLSTRLASQFFVFFLFTYIITLTMIAFFRALASVTKAESTATLLAGLGILVFVLYTGYAIPRPSMKVWFKWISYAHPISFGFEALLTNEFRAYTNTPCANLVPPYAPNVENQVCAIPGAVPGSNTVNANTYLLVNNGYTYSNTWRNFGIIIGFWIFFLIIHLVATEFQQDVAEKPAVLVYKRGGAPAEVEALINATANDEEKLGKDAGQLVGEKRSDGNEQEKAAEKLEASSDVFMFKNVCYDVPAKDGMIRLLNNVNGYVAPGKLTALMGESGAGKTTLLNVLAQRVNTGVVTGDMLVNGRVLPKSFQRQTGYVQQQDVHLATTTVREALEFSALLRQPASVPKAEKLAYVDSVIKMLEMESFENALIGEVGEGLNVEQRKRTTIGVELAAKPALLLFADEPTSGLDSQSAWSIVQFLRKLADHGQAILCTIHQPSSELFQVFDRLLLLKKGGRTAYFGDIGKNSRTLIDYFEPRSGIKCGEQDNPAEYILECVGAGANAKVSQDWGQLWEESEDRKRSDAYIAELEEKYRGKASQADESPDSERSYAASLWTQFKVVNARAFQNYWRDPTFVYGKLMLNILSGLFIGFSFWMAPHTQQGLQVYLFSVFMAIVLAGTLAQMIQPKFIALRALYEVRERPSRMYNFIVQTTASILVEIPWNIFAGTLFWACYYFTVGNPPGQRAIYSWFTYAIAFELYWQTFAQAVAAMSPNSMIASIIFSFLFSFVIVFNGVLQPPALLPYFWRSWMFPLTPFRYLVGGLLANSIGRIPFTCTDEEVVYVTPPAGTASCQDYLGQYVQAATGFLTNPDAGGGAQCGYCQYGNGDEYLATVQTNYTDRWRNTGILFGYIAFNLICIYVFTWAFRFKDWSRKSKASNPKAMKKEAPGPVHDAVAKTEERTKDTGANAAPAFNPQSGVERDANNVTSQNTDRREKTYAGQ